MIKRSYIFFSILAVLFGLLLFYNLRRVPEPGDDAYVTEVPSDVKKVSSPESAKPDITVRVPILLYHYVEYVQDKKDTIRQSLDIPPYVLTSQIETLKKAGYSFITTSDVARALNGDYKLPKNPVILTFDDGYMDFYTDVFPILKEENVRGEEYIITDFLNRPNFMFTFQLKEIAKSGLVEIGAHTMDHVWLRGMSEKRARFEIFQSKKDLENLIGKPVFSFAYPYGAFDQQAIELIKEAGFTNAVSTIPGIEDSKNNEYYMYRIRPGYRTGKELLGFLKQNTFKAY